ARNSSPPGDSGAEGKSAGGAASGVGPGGSWRPGVHPFAAPSVVVPPKIFSTEVAQNKATPLTAPAPPSPPEIVLRQVSRHKARMKLGNQKVPPTGGPIIEVRRQDKPRLASRLVPPPHAAPPPRRLHPAWRSRSVPCSRSSLYDCAKEAFKLVTRRQG